MAGKGGTERYGGFQIPRHQDGEIGGGSRGCSLGSERRWKIWKLWKPRRRMLDDEGAGAEAARVLHKSNP